MNAFFNKVQNKLHEARISDVNHELGKVKENFINESSNYLNLIRSESAKFSQLLASGSSWTRSAPSSGTSSKLSSSTSLPAISPYQVRYFKQLFDDFSWSSFACHFQANPTSSKYKYKSSLASAQEESADDFDSFPEATAAARKLDESVVDRFIRVVETNPVQAKRSQPLASREEIRKKLAASFQETSNPSKSSSNDLQICFINEAVEAVSDDEDTERTRDEAKEDSSDDERTDPLAGRSDALDQQTTNPGLKRKLVKLQAEVQVNLGDCVQVSSADSRLV